MGGGKYMHSCRTQLHLSGTPRVGGGGGVCVCVGGGGG